MRDRPGLRALVVRGGSAAGSLLTLDATGSRSLERVELGGCGALRRLALRDCVKLRDADVEAPSLAALVRRLEKCRTPTTNVS